jgi:hypothetical protein
MKIITWILIIIGVLLSPLIITGALLMVWLLPKTEYNDYDPDFDQEMFV